MKPLTSSAYGRSSVELSDLVLVDKVPISGSVGVYRSRFKECSSNTQSQRTIDNVAGRGSRYQLRVLYSATIPANDHSRVTGNPPNVSHTSEFVFRVHVEDILDSKQCAEKVTTSGVDDTLGFSSRTRCLRN